jgi:hypothetical protein
MSQPRVGAHGMHPTDRDIAFTTESTQVRIPVLMGDETIRAAVLTPHYVDKSMHLANITFIAHVIT